MTPPLAQYDGTWPRWTERVRDVLDQAWDEYLEDVTEQAHMEFQSFFGVFSQSCESPIEALFLAAFTPRAVGDPSYRIRPQYEIGQYRVDFLITFSENDPEYRRDVIVECDGHDYHERTREQAERDKRRDRAITASGIPVLRFTGRELHRDARACVEEVLDFTQAHL